MEDLSQRVRRPAASGPRHSKAAACLGVVRVRVDGGAARGIGGVRGIGVLVARVRTLRERRIELSARKAFTIRHARSRAAGQMSGCRRPSRRSRDMR